jgi:hypothetical protein
LKWKNKKFVHGLQHRLLFLWRGGRVVRPKKISYETKTLTVSVSFHESVACDAKPKKEAAKQPPVATKKKTAMARAIPYDLFPFAHSILMN